VQSENDSAEELADYDKVYHKIIFKTAEARVEFDVKINNDDNVESKEAFRLKLFTSDIRVMLDPNVTTVWINDNDGE